MLKGNVQMKHKTFTFLAENSLGPNPCITETRNNAKCLDKVIEFFHSRNFNPEGLPQALLLPPLKALGGHIPNEPLQTFRSCHALLSTWRPGLAPVTHQLPTHLTQALEPFCSSTEKGAMRPMCPSTAVSAAFLWAISTSVYQRYTVRYRTGGTCP